MTIRSIILGFLAAMTLCLVAYYSDNVIRQTMLIDSHLPIAVYGGLVIFLLTIQPLMVCFLRRWSFSPQELVVILCFTFAICSIPTIGLGRWFTSTMMMPHQKEQTTISWQERGLTERLPDYMLADKGENNEALDAWLSGLSQTGELIALTEIPWGAWLATMTFWLPLVLLIFTCCIGMSLIVHPQWRHHEHLPYPISRVTDELLPPEKGKHNPLYKNKLFLIGAIAVAVLHLNNVLAFYYPDVMIRIPLNLGLGPLFHKVSLNMPNGFEPTWNYWAFANSKFYFVAFGMAYFLSRETSLSIGIASITWGFTTGLGTVYGINLMAGETVPLWHTLFFGSCVGVAVAIIYFGRHYYYRVFRQALTGQRTGRKPKDDGKNDEAEGPSQDNQAYSVWGARLFVGAGIGMVVWICLTGMDWPFAILTAFMILLIQLVTSRLIAESGIFLMGGRYAILAVMLGLFGIETVGPYNGLLIALIGTMFTYEIRGIFMPYIVNALDLAERRGLSPGKMAAWFFPVIISGLILSIAASLYVQHSFGQSSVDPVARDNFSLAAFREAISVDQALEGRGKLEEARQSSLGERLGKWAVHPNIISGFAAGFGLVILFYILRLRFVNFALHPLLFIVWMSWGASVFGFSFLCGWLLKTLITKYGTEKTYRDFKPLILGLIIGEILAAVLSLIATTAIFVFTPVNPQPYSIMPW